MTRLIPHFLRKMIAKKTESMDTVLVLDQGNRVIGINDIADNGKYLKVHHLTTDLNIVGELTGKTIHWPESAAWRGDAAESSIDWCNLKNLIG